MRTQQPNITAEGGTLRRVRSWRWLLLILLALLPVTAALANSEPVASTADDTAEHEPSVHAHGPSDTPICHHRSHDGEEHLLVGHNRETELPAPDDNVAAIPSLGPVHDDSPISGAVLRDLLAADAPHTGPVYLLTRRLRV
ncbi:hypothetical protein QWY84_19730 [Aquisalimonas lutea]|uniref:hypothetical protein n=1 Tax=Aquisalimonas lutea TaxID=1327750 RepID=UPI0025B5BA6E|nr:hypothetical protein [Aquisalimonas lutea]MDN3519839.1 hypothetical protein [Aquisalimonas lutea]